MYTPEGVVFLCVRSSTGRESQEQISSFPSIAKLCPHQTLREYSQMTMSFQTRGDGNTLFLAVCRVVYSPTGGEWPGDEATAEADTNKERQLCVSHSSPWMATAMRASTCQKDGESASSLLHLSVPPWCRTHFLMISTLVLLYL